MFVIDSTVKIQEHSHEKKPALHRSFTKSPCRGGLGHVGHICYFFNIQRVFLLSLEPFNECISIPTIFLWALVQALKVESPQEKQAMSDFPQGWFNFARQALIGSLRIIYMIRSSFIYFPNMAQDRERAFVCCCCCHRH